MKLLPDCREVHRLVSEGLDRELTVVEQLRRRMHLMVCGACAAFDGQMHLMRLAMRRFEIAPEAPPSADPKV